MRNPCMNELPPSDKEGLRTRPKNDPCELCWEMAGELRDMASWLADGELSPEEFALTVSHFEKRKLDRLGFKLSSATSEGPIVHFSLRSAANGELCASMDVNPDSGDFEVQSACAGSTVCDQHDAS